MKNEQQIMERLDRIEGLMREIKKEQETPKLVLNAAETAHALNMSPKSVYNLMHMAGFPPAIKLGNRRVVHRGLLDEWLQEQARQQHETG